MRDWWGCFVRLDVFVPLAIRDLLRFYLSAFYPTFVLPYLCFAVIES